MIALHCMISQQCPRPANAHEYRSRSFKSGEEVRLYDRITLWRWLTLEFDPTVSNLDVNAKIFEGAAGRIPLVFTYLKHGKLRLVIQNHASENAMDSLRKYCDLLDIFVEVLEEKWSSARHVEMWNLMKMASYIHKWSNRITERQLSTVLREVMVSQRAPIKKLCSAGKDLDAEVLALVFELTRRGRVSISDLREHRITDESYVTIPESLLINGAKNG